MDTDWNTWMVSTFGVSTPSFTTPSEYSSELIEEINNENQNARGYRWSIQWQRYS